MRKICFFTSLFCSLVVHFTAFGQSAEELNLSKSLFEGIWVNKTEHRYIQLTFDESVDYVNVNDWLNHLKINKKTPIDLYKAFIQGDSLIVPEDKACECPTCVFKIENNQLVYTCYLKQNPFGEALSKETTQVILFDRLKK